MIAVLFASLAPAVALLTYFYLNDRYKQEPLRLVFRLFLFGVIICFPVMIIQHGLRTEISAQPLFMSYITAGLLEEFFKWFILYFFAYHLTEFDEPYDGIVYAVSVSLGFAALENFLYLFTEGLSIAFIRALIPVSGHALFGVIMGYYMGTAKFLATKKNMRTYLLYSLMVPVLLHGTYDYIIYRSHMYWFWTIVPFMIWLWWFALKHVKRANQNSKILLSRQKYKHTLEKEQIFVQIESD
jgi:RsiW-degrading membrane proteinase PrsW (M82 family)